MSKNGTVMACDIFPSFLGGEFKLITNLMTLKNEFLTMNYGKGKIFLTRR